jgi:hypothetical protein
MVWLEPADVGAFGGIRDVDGNDALESATAAAVAFVERQRADLPWDQEEWLPAADIKQGAAMLAARLYERRGSLLGVAGSAGYEAAGQILRYDPDIEQLLGIGRSRPFGFGSAPVTVDDDEVTV